MAASAGSANLVLGLQLRGFDQVVEGVGFTRKPPIFLKAGDVVEVEIEKLGILSNPVIDE